MKKKRPAIEKAEPEYIKIVELKPTPPPRWVIAAGSQVGGLWGNFVREFRAAPIPTDIKKDTELRNAYYGALDEASEPDKLKAKAAFEMCLDYSVKYQFFDEYSRKCEVWLSKTYKNEYHVVDEFRASPTNIGSGLNDRPYPLEIGGKPYNEAPAPPPPPVTEKPRRTTKKPDKPKKGGGAARPPKAGGRQEGHHGRARCPRERSDRSQSTMKRHQVSGVACSVLFALVGACGGGRRSRPKAADKAEGSRARRSPSAEAAKGYNDALQAMVAHDKANDWNDATCNQIAKLFLDASGAQKSDMKRELPEALYNAGLAYQRCNKDAEAKEQFQAALAIDQKFHHARVQIALYDLKEKGDGAIEPVIAELQQAVRDAQFQNVEALVNLAMLQMKRRNANPDQDGANDYDRAKKNLQRALAIDDGYQPAFNQLALYYLEIAKEKAGRASTRRKTATFAKTKKADSQQLELAALVCSQAIRKNPNYAAIHNTAGLIQVELQDINGAVREFQTAAKLDPTFFEAQMNFAAVNLSFRGFKAAEDAYRAALKIRPNDYDAHLGLALAIRGQINDSNFDQRVAEAQAELEQCKKLAPDRAETLYNEAILTQEYKAKGGGKNAIPMLEQASAIYDNFVARAGGQPEFADAVKRSRDRSQDIRDTVKFIKEGQTAAAIEAARQEKEQNAPHRRRGRSTGGRRRRRRPPSPAPAPAPPSRLHLPSHEDFVLTGTSASGALSVGASGRFSALGNPRFHRSGAGFGR